MTNRTVTILVALSLAGGLAACQPDQPEETATERERRQAVMATLDSMRADFESAVAAGDFEKQANFYTTDAVYGPPGMSYVQGRDSIRAVLRRSTPPGATLEIRPLESRLIGEDWVYEMGVGTFSFTPEGASEARKLGSTYLVLFKRTPEGWRIHREVLSPTAPPQDAGGSGQQSGSGGTS